GDRSRGLPQVRRSARRLLDPHPLDAAPALFLRLAGGARGKPGDPPLLGWGPAGSSGDGAVDLQPRRDARRSQAHRAAQGAGLSARLLQARARLPGAAPAGFVVSVRRGVRFDFGRRSLVQGSRRRRGRVVGLLLDVDRVVFEHVLFLSRRLRGLDRRRRLVRRRRRLGKLGCRGGSARSRGRVALLLERRRRRRGGGRRGEAPGGGGGGGGGAEAGGGGGGGVGGCVGGRPSRPPASGFTRMTRAGTSPAPTFRIRS